MLDNDSASFVWNGRKSPEKVGVAISDRLAFHNLNALSSGQSVLLGIFGTLLRYGDMSSSGPAFSIESIEGICIVDEIDAHIHIELQSRILPRLIKMFPKVQFIVTNHSPLFVLGMEREFGPDGIQVIEMPGGLPVGAEAYTEFGKALEIMAATAAFTERVVAEARADGKPKVYVEGETDAPYLIRAAELRGKSEILQRCDIEWIGAKDEHGQAFNTGKDALKHALSVFKANPSVVIRRILLLHDNDSNSPDKDYDGLIVRTIPKNQNNSKVKVGIENLLSEDCIEDRFYDEKTKVKDSGDSTITRILNKSALCQEICQTGTSEQFAAFDGALQIIEEFLHISVAGSAGSAVLAEDE